jgi:hypothetical protein
VGQVVVIQISYSDQFRQTGNTTTWFSTDYVFEGYTTMIWATTGTANLTELIRLCIKSRCDADFPSQPSTSLLVSSTCWPAHLNLCACVREFPSFPQFFSDATEHIDKSLTILSSRDTCTHSLGRNLEERYTRDALRLSGAELLLYSRTILSAIEVCLGSGRVWEEADLDSCIGKQFWVSRILFVLEVGGKEFVEDN